MTSNNFQNLEGLLKVLQGKWSLSPQSTSKTITFLLALVFPCLKEDIDDRPVKRIEPTLKQKEGNDDEILQVVRGCSAVGRQRSVRCKKALT